MRTTAQSRAGSRDENIVGITYHFKNKLRASNGGEAGIRTLGGDQPSTVFKTAAFGRSATSPKERYHILIIVKINRFNVYC